MNKFAEITVVRFLNGKTAETFESDNDVQTGRYTQELAGKVRIVWDQGNTVEWVKRDKLTKLDKSTYQLESDILPSPDNSHATVEALEAALNASRYESPATPAKRTSRAKTTN